MMFLVIGKVKFNCGVVDIQPPPHYVEIAFVEEIVQIEILSRHSLKVWRLWRHSLKICGDCGDVALRFVEIV